MRLSIFKFEQWLKVAEHRIYLIQVMYGAAGDTSFLGVKDLDAPQITGRVYLKLVGIGMLSITTACN